MDPDQARALEAELKAELASMNSDDLVASGGELIRSGPSKDSKLVTMRWEEFGELVTTLMKAKKRGQMIASLVSATIEDLEKAQEAINDAEEPLRDFWLTEQLVIRRRASLRARSLRARTSSRAHALGTPELVAIEVGAFGGGIAVAGVALATAHGGFLVAVAAVAGISAVVSAAIGFLFRGAAGVTRPLAVVLVVVGLVMLVLPRGSAPSTPRPHRPRAARVGAASVDTHTVGSGRLASAPPWGALAAVFPFVSL